MFEYDFTVNQNPDDTIYLFTSIMFIKDDRTVS